MKEIERRPQVREDGEKLMDVFSILLSGCETGQRFRCYVVAMPSAAERKHSTATPTVVLARFSVWCSAFYFLLILKRPRCFVTTIVLFLTEKIGRTRVKQNSKKKFRSQTVLFRGKGNSFIHSFRRFIQSHTIILAGLQRTSNGEWLSKPRS